MWMLFGAVGESRGHGGWWRAEGAGGGEEEPSLAGFGRPNSHTREEELGIERMWRNHAGFLTTSSICNILHALLIYPSVSSLPSPSLFFHCGAPPEDTATTMSRPGGKLWQGSDDDSSASEAEAVVELGAAEKRQQKRWEVDSDSGTRWGGRGWRRTKREEQASLSRFPLIRTYIWAC